MLPEERIRTQNGRYVEAYLIELRSLAGLSGSPVLINPPREDIKDGRLAIREGDMYPWLGILVGLHVVESKEDQVLVPRFQESGSEALDEDARDDEGSLDQRNTGFGVVIPIERALDIVERPDVRAAMAAGVALAKLMGQLKPASQETGGARDGDADEEAES
jgi:hypothetical protein